MFTLLRNLSIIASILLLLVGGILHHLRQEESTAFYILVRQLSGKDYVVLSNGKTEKVFNHNASLEMFWIDEEWVIYNEYSSIIRKNIFTDEEQILLTSACCQLRSQLLRLRNKQLLALVAPIISANTEFSNVLYSLGTTGEDINLIAPVDINTSFIPSIDNQRILFQPAYAESYYQSTPNGQIKTITMPTLFHTYQRIESPDRQSYLRFDYDTHYWTVFNNVHQTKMPIARLIDSVEGYTPLAWLPNNWILMRREIFISTMNNPQYSFFRVRPDGTEFDLLLESTDQECKIQKGLLWGENGQQAFIICDDSKLRRVDLETLQVDIVLENAIYFNINVEYGSFYEPLGALNSSEWNILYAHYNESTSNSSVYTTNLLTGKTHHIYTLKDSQWINRHFTDDNILVITDRNSIEKSILLDIRTGVIITRIEGQYIDHSPLIDRPYHGELPFLLSAWCGFMALLLEAVPKVLYQEETLHPLNEISE